jgi:hypothetical protein
LPSIQNRWQASKKNVTKLLRKLNFSESGQFSENNEKDKIITGVGSQ